MFQVITFSLLLTSISLPHPQAREDERGFFIDVLGGLLDGETTTAVPAESTTMATLYGDLVVRLQEDESGWTRLHRSDVPTQKYFPAPVIKTRHALQGKTFNISINLDVILAKRGEQTSPSHTAYGWPHVHRVLVLIVFAANLKSTWRNVRKDVHILRSAMQCKAFNLDFDFGGGAYPS